MSDTHAVLYDPHGLIEAELPLDRAPYEALVTAVLAWKDPHLQPRDYEQIALQLAGHARAIAADVRRHTAALPKNDGRGALAEVVLHEADRRLSAPLERTARLVGLDVLEQGSGTLAAGVTPSSRGACARDGLEGLRVGGVAPRGPRPIAARG